MYQTALIAMSSQWDWYARNLGRFVEFARRYSTSPSLNAKQEKNLKRLGWLSINKQLEALSLGSGATFGIEEVHLENLREMSLVRNLGLHNRWEVDEDYIRLSKKTGSLGNGNLRLVEVSELYAWHGSWVAAISETARSVGVRYPDVPRYPQT